MSRWKRCTTAGRRPVAGGSRHGCRLAAGRGRQIVEVHQQARRDAEEIDAAIRLQGQHGIDAQRTLPDGDRITDARAQCRGQTLVDPDRAGRRHATRRRIGDIQRRRNAQGAAQRISGTNRLDLGQLRPQLVSLAARHHAREGTCLDHLQAARARLVGQLAATDDRRSATDRHRATDGTHGRAPDEHGRRRNPTAVRAATATASAAASKRNSPPRASRRSIRQEKEHSCRTRMNHLFENTLRT
jgi:hypothetical protein